MGTNDFQIRDPAQWSRFHSSRGWVVGLLVLLFLAACGGGDSQPASSTIVLQTLQITPASNSLPRGLTVQLSAIGTLSNGSHIDLTDSVTWTSSDTSVASVDSGGSLASVGIGHATVTATVNSLSTQAGVDVTSAALMTINIQPSSQALAKGLATGFRAFGLYTDGSQQEITAQAAWTVADSALAQVDSPAGRFTALASGVTTVTASLAGVSADASLNVTDATLVGLRLSPAQTDLALGRELSLTATGLYSDDTWGDVTTQVQWQSSDSGVATVDGGRVSGVVPGTATVTASLAGYSSDAVVNITNAALTSLEIAPGNAVLAVGNRLVLEATGLFSDGSRQALGDQVLWGSSDSSLVAIGTGADGAATVEALAPGTVQLTADLGGIHASVPLQVKAAALTAIQVLPQTASLAMGSSLTLSARGDYTDGSSQVLDAQVTWESPDATVAVVDAGGIVTPVAPGTTYLTASVAGISGSMLLTVTDALLESIEVVLADPVIAMGSHCRLMAIGHYSDGTTQDLTDQVYWDSSDGSIVDIRDSRELEGLAAGAATISARFDGVESQVALTVTDAVLDSLEITPALPSVVKGGSLALSVAGHYSDATQQDLTTQATWSSGDENIATISNSPDEEGQVHGIGSGTVALTASLNGVSTTATLTVLDDPQAPVALTVVATPNAILGNGTDSTVLQVSVQAADAAATVADGTVIDYQITDGTGILSATTATASNGQASVELRADVSGVVLVKATVAGSAVSNSAAIYAVSDFSKMVVVAKPFAGTITNGVVQTGAVFGLFAFNISNRDFNLDRFRFFYGGEMVIDSDDPVRLHNNQLPGKTQVGVVVRLADDFLNDSFLARFLLSDSASGQNFSVEAAYTLSE
jgi:hypothetical protein